MHYIPGYSPVTLADCKIITYGDGPLGVDVKFSSKAELDDLIKALTLLRGATDFDHVHLQDHMFSKNSPPASAEIVFHLPGSCFDSIRRELVAEAGRRIEAGKNFKGRSNIDPVTAKDIQKELEALSTPEKKTSLPRFFKTGKGQYGEGDRFIGVVVPDIREVAKRHKNISHDGMTKLLHSKYHECRLCALLILVERFRKAEEAERKEIYEFYLSSTRWINNWDLVDISARDIVGEYLVDKDRAVLYKLAGSELLWDQRIAMIATFAFIRRGDLDDIFALAKKLLRHRHDLMHKAVGWMLREAGKKDKNRLCGFLDRHRGEMPRTMLRYSLEKFSAEERAHYMADVAQKKQARNQA